LIFLQGGFLLNVTLLLRRVYEHKHKINPGYSSKYNTKYLVYYDTTCEVRAAIAREKEIKGWTRSKKIALIETTNPQWLDLSSGWYDENCG
jgi:putative endonuclease